MTREEAKEILISTLRDINSDSEDFECTTEQFTEAMLIAIEELSKPSLPSNLDEAANNYGIYIRLGYPRVMDGTDKYIYNAFKAGAEWMVGQGETHELTVESPVLGPPMICCPVHADNSDKVVVQIRKK